MAYRGLQPCQRVVLVLLLAALVLGSTAAAQRERSCTLHMLAVRESEGVVVDAALSLSYPGRGLVIIEPVELVEDDTRTSTRLAVFYALLISHKDPLAHDVYMRFLEGNGSISGASGSGFVALATALLAKGLKIPGNVTMTGMLTPVGLLASVGGLSEKLRAAMDSKLSPVLVPSIELPDIKSLGEEGVKVLGVCGVEDSLALVVGGKYRVEAPEIEVSKALKGVFADDAQRFAELLEKLMNSCTANSTLVKELATQAKKALRKGDFYAAASFSFYALNLILSTNTSCLDTLKTLLGLRLEEVMDSIAKAASSYVKHVGRVRLSELEGLATFALRAYMAEGLALRGGKAAEVQATLRALTALSWYKLTRLAGPELPVETVRLAAAYMVKMALLSREYARALGAKNMTMPDGRTVDEWLNDARSAFMKGDLYGYAKSIGLSAAILARISTAMYLPSGPPTRTAECAISLAKERAARQLLSLGVTSMAALLLTDYAEKLAPVDATAATAVACQALAWELVVDALAAASEAKSALSNVRPSGLPNELAVVLGVAVIYSVLCYLYIRFLRKEVEERYSL